MMENTHSQRLDKYRKSTERIADQLGSVRLDIFNWIEQNDALLPDIRQIAKLEAFHAERARLVAELLEVEQDYMDYLLDALKERAD